MWVPMLSCAEPCAERCAVNQGRMPVHVRTSLIITVFLPLCYRTDKRHACSSTSGTYARSV